MGIMHYPSLPGAEVIDVEFLTLDGGIQTLRLLVDSGFSGRSSFVLPEHVSSLAEHCQTGLPGPSQCPGELSRKPSRGPSPWPAAASSPRGA